MSAGDLAKKGYDVTVFEALHLAGGVLDVYKRQGVALAVKEKLDEQVAREEQKKQQHEQTMGGL